jgi:glycosyltransferase involved in cell wall biosynthesis
MHFIRFRAEGEETGRLVGRWRVCYNPALMSGANTQGLRVAINTHLLSGEVGYRRAGVHRYIHELLRHLGQIDHGLRLTALAGRSAVTPAGNLSVVRSRWPTDRAPVRIVWEQTMQPRLLQQLGSDVVHAPVYVGPLLAGCPLVVTLHDLSFIRHPGLLRSGSRLYLTLLTRLTARRACRVIAVSRHTAEEASQLLGVPSDQMDVVYHGVGEEFRPLPTEAVEAFRRRQGLPDRYVLYVGTLEPRKNLVRLAEAFAGSGAKGWSLVLAGGMGWGCGDLVNQIRALGMGDRVLFPGYVADDDLPFLYNAAEVFAYPSLYEGFGMPVLEAMACGTPVLASSTSSLPEVSGDAAILVEPGRTDEIAAGLERLASDAALRQDMRERGLKRARRFDWCKAARETAQVYVRAADRSSS